MEIWLDTANQDAAKKAQLLGILSGVTTNPSILVKDPRPLAEVIESLLESQEGRLAVQVVATDSSAMIEQGQKLHDISDRIIVKIPITKAGLEAIHVLSSDYVPTMATVLFHPKQALMAAMAGAEYVAPYVNRIEKSGEDPWKVLQAILQIYGNYALPTKILAASLSSIDKVMKCTELGIDAVTIREEVFDTLIADDPLTAQCIAQFNAEWKSQAKSFAFS